MTFIPSLVGLCANHAARVKIDFQKRYGFELNSDQKSLLDKIPSLPDSISKLVSEHVEIFQKVYYVEHLYRHMYEVNHALFNSVRIGNIDAVIILLKFGDVDYEDDYFNGDITIEYPLLALSIILKHQDITRLLFKCGAEDKKDMFGNNSLILAAMQGDTDFVKILIDKGFNVEQKNIYGTNALILAAENGHIDTVRLLLDNKAKIDTFNNFGITALNVAAYKGHIHVVKLLLNRGADKKIADIVGSTPLKAAMLGDHPDIAELL